MCVLRVLCRRGAPRVSWPSTRASSLTGCAWDPGTLLYPSTASLASLCVYTLYKLCDAMSFELVVITGVCVCVWDNSVMHAATAQDSKHIFSGEFIRMLNAS